MGTAIKKNLLFALIIIFALLINLIPSGTMPYNSEYFLDLEYLGLYNANGFLIGETVGVNNLPQNTNHFILTGLKLLPGQVFPGNIMTVIYCLVLLFSFWILLKSVKNYGFLTAVTLILLLCTKKYVGFLFSILPFGGILTFFVASVSIIIACGVSKKVTWVRLIALSVFSLLFAFYDNQTAFCAIVLGVLIIRLLPLCDKKALKAFAVIIGATVIIASLLFGISYKGIHYDANVESAVVNGINLYGEGTASSYSDVLGFFIKNPSSFIKHTQSLLNNGFYEAPDMPFSLWHLVKTFIPVNILIFGALSIALIAYLIYKRKEYGILSEIGVGLTVIMWVALKSTGIIYGISNLARNLLLYNIVFDTLACMIIVGGVYIILGRKKELKDKYGVTQ